jgi:serine/threonine-protein kinase RsbW
MVVRTKKRILMKENYNSSLDERVKILSQVNTILKNNSILPKITENELVLVVDEAVTNAMEHGNKWDSQKKVHLAIWVEEDNIHISIEDEGDGFDFSNHESEFTKGNKLSHRGRGISLIKKFCNPSWEKSGRLIDLQIPY